MKEILIAILKKINKIINYEEDISTRGTWVYG